MVQYRFASIEQYIVSVGEKHYEKRSGKKHPSCLFWRRSFCNIVIVGQLITWDNLQNAGYFLTSNPANSFYYLMTGLHAIHLLGGLWVWSKSSIRLLSGGEPKDIKLSIELCTLYWHFLLIVWLVLFALLSNT